MPYRIEYPGFFQECSGIFSLNLYIFYQLEGLVFFCFFELTKFILRSSIGST